MQLHLQAIQTLLFHHLLFSFQPVCMLKSQEDDSHKLLGASVDLQELLYDLGDFIKLPGTWSQKKAFEAETNARLKTNAR